MKSLFPCTTRSVRKYVSPFQHDCTDFAYWHRVASQLSLFTLKTKFIMEVIQKLKVFEVPKGVSTL